MGIPALVPVCVWQCWSVSGMKKFVSWYSSVRKLLKNFGRVEVGCGVEDCGVLITLLVIMSA